LQVEINRMLEEARDLESQAMAQVTGKQSYQALAESIEMKTTTLMTQQLLTGTVGPDLEQEVETVMKEVEFGNAYKQLQEKVQESGGAIVDAEFTEVVNPADKAKALLNEAPFGGLLGHEVRPLVRQPLEEGDEEK
jgi:vacuolar-type H+-ATPase subunit E/Vma4